MLERFLLLWLVLLSLVALDALRNVGRDPRSRLYGYCSINTTAGSWAMAVRVGR
jgi:hypothetical protein